MAARVFRLNRPGAAWVALAGLLIAGVLAGALLPPPVWDTWVWRRDLPGQAWRWWTAAWVHWNPLHLAANIAGALALAWLGWAARLATSATLAWALAWPLAHLGLWIVWGPEGPLRYAGLSGVLHAGVAVAVIHLLASTERPMRWIGAALGVGLGAKLGQEVPWQPVAAGVSPGWGFTVAVWAHATGAAAGVILGLATAVPRRSFSSRASTR